MKKTPFNIQMKDVSFQSPEVLSYITSQEIKVMH